MVDTERYPDAEYKPAAKVEATTIRWWILKDWGTWGLDSGIPVEATTIRWWILKVHVAGVENLHNVG